MKRCSHIQTIVCSPIQTIVRGTLSARAPRRRDQRQGRVVGDAQIACACNHHRVSRISVTHFTDPGCPFAYSASPALAVLHWRYGDQLDWRLVTIGLAEDPQRYIDAGYTPTRSTIGQQSYFKRFGMPLLMVPRARVTATSRACRVIVATRLL